MLALPPFRGVTRRLVLGGGIGFVVSLVLSLSPLGPTAFLWSALIPAHLLRSPYTLVSYAFVPNGLLSVIFALLSVWFFGMPMEEQLGPQWLLEYFFVTTVGGGLLASLLTFAPGLRMSPLNSTAGMWPFATALLLAFARFQPNAVVRLFGVVPIRAKLLAIGYVGLYILLAIVGGDRFGAAAAVFASLCGWLYLQYAGRRGVLRGASEGLYGMRNAWYRRKRQRAAKKFKVYMRKSGRDGDFDERGHFIQHDEDAKRDPNDRRWMN